MLIQRDNLEPVKAIPVAKLIELLGQFDPGVLVMPNQVGNLALLVQNPPPGIIANTSVSYIGFIDVGREELELR